MNQIIIDWKVYYYIKNKDSIAGALSLYKMKEGVLPTLAKINENAPEDLILLLSSVPGLKIVERAKTTLPRDVWLSHEEKKPQAQSKDVARKHKDKANPSALPFDFY